MVGVPRQAGERPPRLLTITGAGLASLAIAMGIGRFAFTPILPMMVADTGLSLAAAGWLAAANYLGYLLGALSAPRLPQRRAIRGSLLLIAAVTFAMGVTHVFALQLLLRLLAGVASAWVLVHVSAWAMGHLLALRRSDASGTVFAGVGIGIAVAGLVCMGTMYFDWSSDGTWQLFGLLSLLTVLLLWRAFGDRAGQPQKTASVPPERIHWTTDKWRLMACYGAFGIGYIIPATFLPNMAHHYISDPLVFGLAWPVFGIASALTTWFAARWLAHVDDRKLWAICHVLMAAGVVLPILWSTLAAILIAALLVGGTFMTIVMLGLSEARRTGGAAVTPFIAFITAAFAIGQIIGPLMVSALAQWTYGFAAALMTAAAVLLLAAVSLWRSATGTVQG